jgi:Leucine-rich repeat (LRR) protein
MNKLTKAILFACAGSFISGLSAMHKQGPIKTLSQLFDEKNPPKKVFVKKTLPEIEIYLNLLAQVGKNNISIVFPKNLNGLNLTQDLPYGISIENKNLLTVPTLIFGLKSLRFLSLKNNHLKNFSKQIKNLKNLKELNLSNNNLVGLPEELCTLQELEILDLSNNSLKELPANIDNLKKLKSLDLYGNNFSDAEKEKIIKTINSNRALSILFGENKTCEIKF